MRRTFILKTAVEMVGMANCFKPKTVANIEDFTNWLDAEQCKVPPK
jgi:hypothetical protein